MRHPSLSSSSICSLDLPPETSKLFQQNNNDEKLLPENLLLLASHLLYERHLLHSTPPSLWYVKLIIIWRLVPLFMCFFELNVLLLTSVASIFSQFRSNLTLSWEWILGNTGILINRKALDLLNSSEWCVYKVVGSQYPLWLLCECFLNLPTLFILFFIKFFLSHSIKYSRFSNKLLQTEIFFIMTLCLLFCSIKT